MAATTHGRGACALGALALTLGLLAGCEPYPSVDERWDDDIVATSYEPDTRFGKFQTFTVDPTIYVLKELSDGGVQREQLPAASAQPIVAAVARNMRDRGYEEVDADADPDLGLALTAVNAQVSGTATAWWGCGGYWGYWGYSCYYPYSVSYSYRTGSLVTDMIDLSQPLPDLPDGGVVELDAGAGDPAMALPIVWSALAYEVLDGNKPDVDWATASIDQAFAQSPYLERN